MSDDLQELHEHLKATEELPVRPDASVWLGEAAAVAADVADGDTPSAVVVDRVGRVAALLAEVETTGNADADDHVDAAERIALRIVESGDEGTENG